VRRSHLIALIAAGVVVVLFVSAVLARVWNGDAAEQSAVTSLLRDEARGDPAAMVAAIRGCAGNPACRARATYDAATLKRPGSVSILQYEPSTGFSLTGTLGTARVAWEIIDETRPITQCVRVRRAGNALSGIRIELLAITRRLAADAACPSRF
jgi:hypothetical protein